MKDISKRMLLLAVACLATMVAMAPAASAAATPCLAILGAGSSLQKVAQNEVWITGFTANPGGWWENLCEKDPVITYDPTSSGKGKEQWGYENKTLGSDSPFEAYIGTDLAPSDPQIKNMGEAAGLTGEEALLGVVTVPVAQSAIGVIVSLPTTCHPSSGTTANVKAVKLAEEWEKGNQEFTAIINNVTCSGASLPNLKARSSNSGTTSGFKRYLATRTDTAEWLSVTSTPLKSEEKVWPAAVEASGHFEACCEKGSQLALLVYDNSATIGYADLADARHEGFTTSWVNHKNAANELYLSAIALVETSSPLVEFESPEEGGGGSNCKKAEYKEQNSHAVAPGEDWSEVKQANVNENEAYPICTLTYDLAWHLYDTSKLLPKYGPEFLPLEHIALTVIHYLHTIILRILGQGSTLTAKHFGALPLGIQMKAEEGVNETNIVP